MVNYTNGKIYKIVSDDTPNMCYIGSTTQTLSKRLGKHKSSYKQYLKDKKSYTSSYELIKTGNAIIYLIEDCACTTKNKLLRREGELIRQYQFDPSCEIVLNKIIAGRTQKEYRQDNKVKLNLQKKQYHQDNKERTTKSVTCPHCSRTVQHRELARHQRTKVCKSHQ